MNTLNATASSSPQSGCLAREASVDLPVQPLHSQRGWYLGTFSNEEDTMGPVSRESEDYFASFDDVAQALHNGTWTQRHSL
jgi:hypothetical protein